MTANVQVTRDGGPVKPPHDVQRVDLLSAGGAVRSAGSKLLGQRPRVEATFPDCFQGQANKVRGGIRFLSNWLLTCSQGQISQGLEPFSRLNDNTECVCVYIYIYILLLLYIYIYIYIYIYAHTHIMYISGHPISLRSRSPSGLPWPMGLPLFDSVYNIYIYIYIYDIRNIIYIYIYIHKPP